MQAVGDFFQIEPEKWGLRGDPYLWRELRDKLANVELPLSLTEFHRLLENVFWEATGETLTFCQEFKIERFAHGGMSSGGISGDFWREQGMRLIIARFKAVSAV